MTPILDRKCPKCGFLTLAKSGKYEYCMSSKSCAYSDKPIIKVNKININQEIKRCIEEDEFNAYECLETKTPYLVFGSLELTEEDMK